MANSYFKLGTTKIIKLIIVIQALNDEVLKNYGQLFKKMAEGTKIPNPTYSCTVFLISYILHDYDSVNNTGNNPSQNVYNIVEVGE